MLGTDQALEPAGRPAGKWPEKLNGACTSDVHAAHCRLGLAPVVRFLLTEKLALEVRTHLTVAVLLQMWRFLTCWLGFDLLSRTLNFQDTTENG